MPEQVVGAVVRQEFGASEVARSAETASTAVAAQAKAAVEARYILALRKPRDWEEVRLRLEKECKRPGFAESAWYQIQNRGEGFSIRFAEAALRSMTNAYPETTIVYEGPDQRIVQVTVMDLEANVTYSQQVIISKTVERRNAKGREVVAERVNTHGDTIYIVQATDEEMLGKQNSLISKALRTLALRLLPGDIQDGCEAIIQQTRADKTAKDPDAARRKVVDAFASLGVTPTDLAAYLGHQIGQATTKELIDLSWLCQAIKDGETTWAAVMEARAEAGGSAPTGSREAQQQVLAEKLAAAKAAKGGDAAEKPRTETNSTEAGPGTQGFGFGRPAK